MSLASLIASMFQPASPEEVLRREEELKAVRRKQADHLQEFCICGHQVWQHNHTPSVIGPGCTGCRIRGCPCYLLMVVEK